MLSRNMSSRVEKVVIIQDGNKQIETTALNWALNELSLKPHHHIALVPIIPLPPQLRSASACCLSPIFGFDCSQLIRGNRRLDCSYTMMKKKELIDGEIPKKMDEFHNNPLIKNIFGLCELRQIEFQITVKSGNSIKESAVMAVKELEATCVILDRLMKRDSNYIKEQLVNLSCGVLRIKQDDTIEVVRELPWDLGQKLTTTPGNPLCKDKEDGPRHETLSGKQTHGISYENFATSVEAGCWKGSGCSVCKSVRPDPSFYAEFRYGELEDATKHFSPENLLASEGGDEREIYKGTLSNGTQILVKQHYFYSKEVRKSIKSSKGTKEKQFRAEAELLGKARQENVAMLLGFCSEQGHRLLVYEYVCYGSLHRILSKRIELPWERRLKIATGVAKGLQYLHSSNIFGHVRPKNILLTHDYKPLLVNYGLKRNGYEEELMDESTGERGRVKRTFEYLAPEYEETGQDSSQSDVYSLGVILLELITGRRTLRDTNGRSFLTWARPLLKAKKYDDLIDPAVLESHDLHQLVWMVRVVEKCLFWDPHKRCSIDKVMTALTGLSQGLDIRDFSPPDSV